MKEQPLEPKEPREKPERDEMEAGKDLIIEKIEEASDDLDDQEQMFIDMFEVIQARVHQQAIDNGWWEDYHDIRAAINNWGVEVCAHNDQVFQKAWQLSKIALMHSELSECVEGIREKIPTPDQHCSEFTQQEIEIADVIIRAMDLAQGFDWHIAEAIIAKMRYNATRPYKHGKLV